MSDEQGGGPSAHLGPTRRRHHTRADGDVACCWCTTRKYTYSANKMALVDQNYNMYGRGLEQSIRELLEA